MPWEIESFLIQHPMGDKFAQVNESYHLIVLEVQICQEQAPVSSVFSTSSRVG